MHNNDKWKRFVSDQVVRNMKKLYQNHEISLRIQMYYKSKFRLVSIILLVGVLFLTALYLEQRSKSEITDGNIMRNSYGGGTKNITLAYETEGNNADGEHDVEPGAGAIQGNIELKISEKQYNVTHICKIVEEFKKILLKEILSNNASFDRVTENLRFVNGIEGYPFSVEYKTDNPMILSRDGMINQERVSEAGSQVTVTALIRYGEYEEELVFGTCIYRHKLSYNEEFNKNLAESMEKADRATINYDYFALPSEIYGKKITFYDKKDSSVLVLAAFLVVAAVAVFFGKDKEIAREAENRDRQLKADYPGFVNRFALFYTAGMPAKKIFMKMCSEYEREKSRGGKRRYLYEELILVRSRINDGECEVDAYEAFVKHISIAQYKEFMNLVIQNLDRGRNDFIYVLRRETQNAFLDKVNNSKKLLEEASTKLLIPMFMMLLVVMVIVMYPAFCSFGQ